MDSVVLETVKETETNSAPCPQEGCEKCSSKFIETQTQREEILYDALCDEKLELTILPTEHCNFRCTYCYEDFSVGKMSRETIDSLKLFISRRSVDLKHLSISWFGGEPLLAYDIVKEISAHAQSVASEHKILFSNGITTNGHLLSHDRILELHSLGARNYQISLDGDSEWHNKTRVQINGKGSFDRIWRNILIFNELYKEGKIDETSVMLRLHLHPENVHSVKRLVEKIKNELDTKLFTVFVKEVSHLGGKNDKDIEIFNSLEQDYIALKAELNQVTKDFTLFDVEPGTYVCYAAKGNSYMVRANGNLGKCTVALNSSSNNIGKLKADGSLELAPEKLGKWLYALSSMNKSDLMCPLHNLPKDN